MGAKREIVLVCGMHRSGTSALTRVCNLLGGALPHPLVEPAIGNELGLWEPAQVVAMNDRALLSAGSDVNSVFPVSPDWLRSAAAEAFTTEVQAYISGLGDAPKTWFVKDPRISVLAGLWRDGAARTGVQPRFIIAFRNPWEVAASLSARQLHHFPDEVWPLERGVALWLNYMLTVERQSRGLPRSFVSYEALLGDWRGEVGRVYDQLGFPKPPMDAADAIDRFIRPDQRHARHETLQTRHGLAMSVYQGLLDRLSDPAGGQADFDRAGAAFAGSFDILGGYLAALEGRAAEFVRLKARTSLQETSLKDKDAIISRLEALQVEPIDARAHSADGSAQALAAAKAELDLFRRSTSWRITAPLRAAAMQFRRH